MKNYVISIRKGWSNCIYGLMHVISETELQSNHPFFFLNKALDRLGKGKNSFQVVVLYFLVHHGRDFSTLPVLIVEKAALTGVLPETFSLDSCSNNCENVVFARVTKTESKSTHPQQGHRW